MTEALAAFGGSVIGVTLGIVTVAHLGRRHEERQAAKRQASKAAHPAGKQVVQSEVEYETTARKFRRAS